MDATREAGLDFVHVHGGTTPIVIYETVPPGAAFFDADADGDLDLFVVQSGHRRFPRPAGAPQPTHRLYRNDGPGPGGVPRFTDVTQRAGVGGSGYGVGAVAADVDNDGDQDLFVAQDGPDLFYLNQGDGTFRETSGAARVGDSVQSTGAAFADVDGNGYLDLYVASYVDVASGPLFCHYEGVKSGCSDLEYDGLPDAFFLNDGPGPDGVPRFREAAAERGLLDPEGRGFGVVFSDLDDDGDLDLYVANDGGSNRLYVNDGQGRFTDQTLLSGTGYSEEGRGQASMGLDVADYDNDGRMDIYTTNFSMETDALYRNEGGLQFSYHIAGAGLARASFLPLSWGIEFFDADLDGDLDLFIANGHVYDVAAQINPLETFAQRNQLYLNRGDGSFEDVSAEAGPGLEPAAVGRGAAFGDVDDDGDVDIYVANNGGPGRLLINDTPRAGHRALRLRLEGRGRSNRDAVGARVTVQAGGRRQVREVKAGTSYLSCSDKRLVVGLGKEASASVKVRWPSGAVQEFRDLPADTPIRLIEGEPSWSKDVR
ncbi:MAG TPA: CRTAC1 family protein [Candidatus Polarisedimenticolia bacterium]|nr:CRTAC1 family protein [Candidatus Polarisedimenticolia bacterium]